MSTSAYAYLHNDDLLPGEAAQQAVEIVHIPPALCEGVQLPARPRARPLWQPWPAQRLLGARRRELFRQ